VDQEYRIKRGFELRCNLSPWTRGVEFCLFDGHAYATAIVMKADDEHGREIKPLFNLQPDAAQQLMDDLWRAGLRPSEGSGSAGSLKATERHLDDMRMLVFALAPSKMQAALSSTRITPFPKI
jgi:hypothetical protein